MGMWMINDDYDPLDLWRGMVFACALAFVFVGGVALVIVLDLFDGFVDFLEGLWQ
jgi:succinate dehydrogenase hydrophobic anchor subunit